MVYPSHDFDHLLHLRYRKFASILLFVAICPTQGHAAALTSSNFRQQMIYFRSLIVLSIGIPHSLIFIVIYFCYFAQFFVSGIPLLFIFLIEKCYQSIKNFADFSVGIFCCSENTIVHMTAFFGIFTLGRIEKRYLFSEIPIRIGYIIVFVNQRFSFHCLLNVCKFFEEALK